MFFSRLKMATAACEMGIYLVIKSFFRERYSCVELALLITSYRDLFASSQRSTQAI